MIIKHLDQFVYIYTFAILVIVTIILNFTKGRNWLVIHRKIIAIIFGTAQFILYIYTSIFWAREGAWYAMLLHDLCPLLSFLSIIVFYLNKESIYKAIMPWLLIGSTITMFTGKAPFFSNPIWLSSYFEHTMMLMQGILAYFWISKYKKSEFLNLLILPTFLVLWNILTALIPWKISGDSMWADTSTGLLPPSILPGKAFDILGSFSWLPYPLPTIIFYALSVSIAMLIALNKNTSDFYKRKFLIFFRSISKNKKQKTFITNKKLQNN